MQASKAMAELYVAVAKEKSPALKELNATNAFKLTYPIVWNDDDKKTLETNFVSGEEKLLTLKLNQKPIPSDFSTARP